MNRRKIMRIHYSHREAGFLRIKLFGIQWKVIDTRKHRPIFSDRKFGFRVGPFIFRAHVAF